jgi:VIT1/CCC1 family predicted Fe2+/Mn2+ transporter
MVVIMTIPVFFASNPIALFVSVAVCGAVTIYVIASCTRIQTEEADAAT